MGNLQQNRIHDFMNEFKKGIALTLLILFMLSCSNEGRLIKVEFVAFKKAVMQKSDAHELLKYTDKRTSVYFSEIIRISRDPSPGKLRLFTKDSEHPLTDLLLILTLNSIAQGADVDETFVCEMIKQMNFPILTASQIRNFVIMDVGRVISSEKTVPVKIKGYAVNQTTGEPVSLLTKLTFMKEDGVWKLNLPSAFSLNEKAYALAAKKAKMPPEDYIRLLAKQESILEKK